MDLMEMGAQMIAEKLGVDIDPATVQAALSGVMGDGKGGLDLSKVAAQMANSGSFGSVLESWLGDGDNASISATGIEDLFGKAQLSQLAGALGAGEQDLAGTLSQVLPQIMDKASQGGALKDEFAGGQGGDIGSLLNAAKSFLG
ncbi:hypothetical protein F3N42_02515 [Marinihelvus fidelis]|uniref:DUF937 domain-containing protein n=1 Tax=Marinihelvus fidelis TaxID=2613842 RepID=A0A5N0TIY3_9GAMM|nr:YidB family protein [Marinihelvus fidelis]KAA9133249.1 hypothetical protein F3N42_02515 [Marinihelvus fidelis]